MMQRSTQGNIAIACLLISAALLLFIKQPLDEAVGAKKTSLEGLNTQRATLEQELADTQEHITVMEGLSSTQKKNIEGSIAPSYRQDDLLEDIVALAQKNFITLEAMGFTRNDASDFTDTLKDTLTVTLTSPNQRQFIRFLEALENDPRVYRIQKITADYQASTVETTLLIETYHLEGEE